MRALLLALLASAAPVPALAQQVGHAGHDAPQPAPADSDPHAGRYMPASTPPDPHAGHSAPAPTATPDPHAGHGTTVADPHAGHGAPPAASAIPEGPPPAAALSGPEHAADRIFGAAAMAASREALRREHGDSRLAKVMIDRLEAGFGSGHDSYAWEGHAWTGNDIDKLWLATEGEGERKGALESAEVQLLWSHAINPWFDLRAGVRQDFRPTPRRSHLALGVAGLAPYWIEVDAALFLSHKGEVSARIEAEHDMRLTQQLILQPRLEADLAFQDSPALGIGAGLSTVEASMRLRHEFRPDRGPAVIAPYIGVAHERAFGDTARYRRADGERRSAWKALVGLHTWF